jgi:hypothetical protein
MIKVDEDPKRCIDLAFGVHLRVRCEDMTKEVEHGPPATYGGVLRFVSVF